METKRKFKVAIIGGGPGGYVAAIRAAASGASVALIEKEHVGGTCLNWGCIPTKTLLASADVLHQVRNAEKFGIHVGSITFDYAAMNARKNEIVAKIKKSLEGLITSHKVTIIRGTGSFISPHEIKVSGQNNEIIEAEQIIIATGSSPKNIKAFPFDHKKIHDSTSILELTSLPKKLVIVGGGVIGCEFASLFAELGVEVVILEALQSLLPLEDKSVASNLSALFAKKGIQFHTQVTVKGIDTTHEGVTVTLDSKEPIHADMALVAVGRSLNTYGIGLEKAGVMVEDNGAIPVNKHMQTSVPHIFAIGDITAKVMLAHVASHQGIVAAANAIGKKTEMHYEAVPNVIFTNPEIATVGLTLEKAIEMGFKANSSKFPFQALGKSIASIHTEGFSQLVFEEKTGRILGAQVIGHEASILIAPMVLAIQNELTLESITETIHAHPTTAESWLEAALIATGTPIHFPPQKKASV
ncbi:MAG: dihydrolipoyl dehydrogenase [Chlamydiales bacterium]|nr:dihydrolipoyl dehydrogenase [Chlamydiales bacterium]